jgi:hypothetical protein
LATGLTNAGNSLKKLNDLGNNVFENRFFALFQRSCSLVMTNRFFALKWMLLAFGI